jgi:hypothetical protein
MITTFLSLSLWRNGQGRLRFRTLKYQVPRDLRLVDLESKTMATKRHIPYNQSINIVISLVLLFVSCCVKLMHAC